MAEAISQWRKRIKSITRDCTVDYLSSEFCFRDPIKNNSGIIYSPADGIVIDVSKVDSVDQLIYTKMGNVCLSSLCHGMIENGNYTCVSIFLTFYDPHIVRMPFDGVVSRKDLPPYYVLDHPMLDFENTIINGRISEIDRREIGTFAFNQRSLFEIFSPMIGRKLLRY